MYTAPAGVFQATFALSAEECHELIVTSQQEWEEYHTTFRLAVAYSRKAG